MISLSPSTSATAPTPSQLNLDRLKENFEDAIRHQSPDFLQEIFGWARRSDGLKATLPYTNCQGLARVRNVGRIMATKPTIISATSKLVSFVIGKGHSYTCAARQPSMTNSRQQKKQEREAAEIQLALDLGLEQLNWMEHQQESYNRLLRDGEVFRRIWILADGVDITYIEPEDIDQPTSRQQIVMETVPEQILSLFQRDTPPGEMGIVSAPGDTRSVLGYWMKKEELFVWVDGQSVQHLKDGVDRNDPRGIPRFYWAFCHVLGIDEVDAAMRTLFLVQAKHAAVYNYEQSTLISDVRALAKHEGRIADDNHRVSLPGVTHAKGFTVDLPGMKASAHDAVEIIQQEQRLIGGCSDIPEHLVSEDANTGNRSSLVAAEGPFDRRVQREQLHLWSLDLPVMWRLVIQMLNWSKREFKEKRLLYKLNPHFPAAHSRDWNKVVESEGLLLQWKVKSRRQVRQTLKIDSDQADQEILADPLDIPDETAQTATTGAA